jgi:hypothetical protein
MGICCAVWNSEIQDIEWVLCEDYAAPVDTQAFFRFEDAQNQLEAQSIISYFVQLENTGTGTADINLETVETTGPDVNSNNEFTSAFRNMVGPGNVVARADTWFEVAPGETLSFSMVCPDVIRVDQPAGSATCGTSSFQVSDGTYYTTLTFQFRDASNNIILPDKEIRTIKQEVTQEVISFSIEIHPPTN